MKKQIYFFLLFFFYIQQINKQHFKHLTGRYASHIGILFFLTDITVEAIAENLKGDYIAGMLELTG